MRFSFSTACLAGYPLPLVLWIAKKLGFDGVELFITPDVAATPVSIVRAVSRRLGVPVLSVHIPKYAPLPGWGSPHDIRLRTAGLAAAVQAPVVVLHGGYGARPGGTYDRAYRASVAACRDVLQGTTTRLSLENNDCHHVPQSDDVFRRGLEQLVAFAGECDLDVTLDTGHVGGPARRLDDAWAMLAPQVVNIHCNNSTGTHDHQRPEYGYLPLARFLSHLHRDQYAGLVTFETHPAVLRTWRPPNMMRALGQSLAFCRSAASAPSLL